MATPKNLRYLPAGVQSAYPLEKKGYEHVLGPGPGGPRSYWRTWEEVNVWCEQKRRAGYYAQAFADKSQVYDSPNFSAFIKRRPPVKRINPESGEVSYTYRGFVIYKNEPDPRLPAYYVSRRGVIHEGFKSTKEAAAAIDQLPPEHLDIPLSEDEEDY